jgi:hypothetical protein
MIQAPSDRREGQNSLWRDVRFTPRKRTFAAHKPMSALGQLQTSTLAEAFAIRRSLLNHLFGLGVQSYWHLQTKSLSGPHIDDQVKLGITHDW